MQNREYNNETISIYTSPCFDAFFEVCAFGTSSAFSGELAHNGVLEKEQVLAVNNRNMHSIVIVCLL